MTQNFIWKVNTQPAMMDTQGLGTINYSKFVGKLFNRPSAEFLLNVNIFPTFMASN